MGNQKGFIGMSADAYFSKVHETIQSAEKALGNGQDMIQLTSQVQKDNENYSRKESGTNSSLNKMGDNMNSMDEFVPGSYVTQYEKNVDKLYDSLSSSAVSSNDDLYEYISDKNTQCEEETTNKLLYAIAEMENLLSEHLQVPTATPKMEAIIKDLKNSFSESSKLSDEQSKEIIKYQQGIIRIDGSGSNMQWTVPIE